MSLPTLNGREPTIITCFKKNKKRLDNRFFLFYLINKFRHKGEVGMNFKKTKSILVLVLVVFSLCINLYFITAVPNVNASIKDVVCQGIGCPNGSRLCGEVDVGPVHYYCYENPPQ